MIAPHIACIVEGHGEVRSVPILIRRIGLELEPPVYPTIGHPIRIPKSSILRAQGELERAIEISARRIRVPGGIVVLIDSDEDCGVTLSNSLGSRARAVRGDLPTSVIIAVREFEAWFLAAARSLARLLGMPEQLESPIDPEAVPDAKGWIKRHRRSGRYEPTVDQPSFTDAFDMSQAQASRSFRKCYQEIRGLLGAPPALVR